MAEEKPKLQTATETFRVYGQDIDVTYNYIEDPEKGKLLQLDKISGRIKLNPSQEVLSNQLFLPEYIKAKHKTDPKKADEWLSGVLQEIIIDKCRTDRDIIAAKPCTNFQAYLMQLAAQIQRDPTKIPYVPESRIGSVIEIKKRIDAKAKAAADISGEEMYGALTITLTIKLNNILDSEDDNESDVTTDYSTDDTDRSHASDNSATRDKKRKRAAIKKKIKKTFNTPIDCSKETEYTAIEDDDIKSQMGGDPMEALSNIFKQYRGRACQNLNTLTESLPYDKYTKMLFNQGSFQFEQFRRIYDLYKKMP
jgi:hypothetical protein